MHIQGWGLAAAAASCTGFPVQPGFEKKSKAAPVSDDSPTLQQNSARTELLSKIKKRINSGFYNSEAVIEDLGHGFAQALDQTL
jgi:hypothetical protein